MKTDLKEVGRKNLDLIHLAQIPLTVCNGHSNEFSGSFNDEEFYSSL
jgi:hypothetical protein